MAKYDKRSYSLDNGMREWIAYGNKRSKELLKKIKESPFKLAKWQMTRYSTTLLITIRDNVICEMSPQHEQMLNQS